MGDERNVIFIYYCGGHNRRSSGVVIEVNPSLRDRLIGRHQLLKKLMVANVLEHH